MKPKIEIVDSGVYNEIEIEFENGDSFSIRVKEDGFEINAQSFKGRMAILPNVSNEVQIKIIHDK